MNNPRTEWREFFAFAPPPTARYFGGAPSIPPGMSAEERESLLEKEAELAALRDQEQRDFMAQQEEMRMAREESQRLLTQQEEEARVAELERLETEGAEVAETMVEDEEIDTSVADMFAALAFGTDFISDEATEPTKPALENKPTLRPK